LSEREIQVPFSPEVARSLAIDDVVYLTGELVVTAGFPTHKRIVAGIEAGEPPPIPLDGAAFFHMGSMSRIEGNILKPLYVNPTTSTRFNGFIPTIIRRYGITALAGKGGLDAGCVAAMQEVGCVYFSMVGGAAPLMTEGVCEVIETGWDDLITQFRLSRIRVERFGPLVVAIDAHGHSTYERLTTSARDRLPEIMARLNAERKPVKG
jgi:fumarate hydratase subunit beta